MRTRAPELSSYAGPPINKFCAGNSKGSNMWMLEYKKDSWWFWLATAIFLSFGVLGEHQFFIFAIILTIIQTIYFSIKLKSIISFPIQVRACYLGLLLISQPKLLQWLYWVPTIGTWAQVLVGYCLMARIVSLFPWNREESFSFQYFKKTIFSRPVQGSIKQEQTAQST